MNPEIKKQWVEALRSGKYSQGRGQLSQQTNYCCLGVLVDICNKWDINKPTYGLPDAEWLAEIGLAQSSANEYASANDDGQSFNCIANMIEADYND